MMLALAGLVARAGGGHSFGGGGGASRSGGGFHTGGGGGFLFLGGGGGGAGGLIGLLVIAVVVIAMFGIFRRRRSRWSGPPKSSGWEMSDSLGAPPSPGEGNWSHSDQPAISTIRGDLFPGSNPEPNTPESSESGLAAIAAHDPLFNQERFLQEVQQTFFIVEGAWTQRKPEMSRQVMADGLWQQHRVQIQGYIDAGKRNVLEDLSVGSMTIIGAHTDANYDTITVRILAACADYDVDDGGKVIRGNKQVDQWMEDWTFQRSSSAKTPKDGGTMSNRCPNCGAPLDLDLSGECKYCKAPVSSGSYDWVLARISQVPRAY